MKKLKKDEYINKAAKLYGLSKFEIDALQAHIDGTMPNDFIQRRCEALFRLYEIYNSAEYNEKIDTDENGIINLNDYCFEISKRRLADSKIGKFWIISSNLEAFLSVTTPLDFSSDVREKFVKISRKNNFFLPQVARQLGLDAAVYYMGVYTDEYGTVSNHHLTKNFLYDEETLIQGNSIVKDNPKKSKINFETILESTDKFIKKYYKKNKLPTDDLDKVRMQIRQGLIKQEFFNKFVFNTNESNEKWGLIKREDKSLRLAPLFSYDYCAGVESNRKTNHRVVQGNKEDIESFMIQYGKELWFREWVESKVIPLDVDKAASDMNRITGISLEPDELDYYKFVLNKIRSSVINVHECEYNRELVDQRKKENLGKIRRIKNIIKNRGTRFKPVPPTDPVSNGIGKSVDDDSDAR